MRLIRLYILSLYILCLLVPTTAAAGDIIIDRAWIQFPYTSQQKVTSAYMEIINNGKAKDTLLGIKTPAAQRVEIHTMRMVDGVMQMRPMEKLAVPAGGRQIFSPGDVHLMLLDIHHAQIAEGKQIPLTLTFEKAGNIEAKAKVKRVSE